METLERLERVDRELAEKWRSVSVALDAKDAADSKQLTFSNEEEESLEESFNDAIGAIHKALQDAEDYVAELTDPVEISETKRSVKFFSDQAKRHVVNVRKVSLLVHAVIEMAASECAVCSACLTHVQVQLIVAYSQRAKKERSEQARSGLMGKRASATGDKKDGASSGSALDVTAALRRTRQVMSQEIQRVSSVTDVLDKGRLSLRSSHEEFGGVQAEIGQVRKRLKALEARPSY